jgi:hypothetical protein
MPSSRPNLIPTVIHIIRQLRPKSILDVGVGFGKWGHLFREYTDILEAEHNPARYRRENWQVRIDGIEGFPDYITEMHRFLYDHIHIGNAAEVIRALPQYDVVFLGDVIEHFTPQEGQQFLRNALDHANQCVVISTPKFETEQDDLCGNDLERHRSLWAARDFKKFPGAQVKTIDRGTLLAVITKPGVKPPQCTPPPTQSPAVMQCFQKARRELAEVIPAHQKFILVDEDQLRAFLPHAKALPFLEKNGSYWGAPADGATAVKELRRLYQSGARHVAFISSTFWWLDHYSELRQYLQTQGKVIHESDAVKIYELPAAS